MKKIELDYVQQCQQIEKSESKIIQKKEENLQNVKLDFEAKILVSLFIYFLFIYYNSFYQLNYYY